MTVALTFKCNSRCNICSIWKIYDEQPSKVEEELKPEDYRRLFTELKDVVWMELTGGEPFLRRDIVEIVSMAYKTRSMANGLTTNGLLGRTVISRVGEILEQVPPDKSFTLGVSIDGLDDVFEKVRGVDGFDKAIRTYLDLREMAAGRGNFTPHIAYTISHLNAGRLEQFATALQEDHGIPIDEMSFSIEHCSNFYHTSNDVHPTQGFKDEAKKDIAYLLKRRRGKESRGIDRVKGIFYDYYLRMIPEYLDNPKAMILPCSACRASAYVDPYGNVYPCAMWGLCLGNIKQNTFSEIWNSPKARKARSEIRAGRCPNCWTPCEAQPSFVSGIERNIWKAI